MSTHIMIISWFEPAKDVNLSTHRFTTPKLFITTWIQPKKLVTECTIPMLSKTAPSQSIYSAQTTPSNTRGQGIGQPTTEILVKPAFLSSGPKRKRPRIFGAGP